MPKLKKSSRKPQATLGLAIILLVIGLAGLSYALKESRTNSDVRATPTPGDLQVLDGNGNDPRQRQDTGSALQGAARTQDLISGEKSDAFQQGQSINQGTSVDELTKDKEIR